MSNLLGNRLFTIFAFIGLSLVLVTDKIFGLSTIALLLIAVFSFQSGILNRLNRNDFILIGLLNAYPLLVGASFAIHKNIEIREFDIPSRFFLITILYLYFRLYEHHYRPILVGALSGLFITLIYTLYLLLAEPGTRVDGNENAITYAQITFLLSAIAIQTAATAFSSIFCRRLTLCLALFSGISICLATQVRGVCLLLPLLFVGFYIFREELGFSKKHCLGIGAVSIAWTIALIYLIDLDYLLFLGKQLSEMTLESETSSVYIRWALWKYSLLLIAQNPFFGSGPGQFFPALMSLSESTHIPEFVLEFSHAHNTLLNLAVELGLIAPIIMLSIFIYPLIACWQLKLKKDSSYLVATCCITWLLFGLTSMPLAHHKITLLTLLILCSGFARGMNSKYGRLSAE